MNIQDITRNNNRSMLINLELNKLILLINSQYHKNRWDQLSMFISCRNSWALILQLPRLNLW